jgi:hypothetical protein
VVANLDRFEPLANGTDNLVEHAKRVFEGELAEVDEIS